MKLILGSGLVGLLARHILGPEWKIIPFGKSRFYSFYPALADDFLRLGGLATDVAHDILPSIPRLYRRPFSFSGMLSYNIIDQLCADLCMKLYGDTDRLIIAKSLFDTTFTVSGTSCSAIYLYLLHEMMKDIKDGLEKGKVKSITNNVINLENANIEFDIIVSTIPLDALYRYMDLNPELEYRSISIVKVRSDYFDLEGADQVIVCDGSFSFYKVICIKPGEYIFFFHERLDDYFGYLSAFCDGRLKIMSVVNFDNYIPIGLPPKLSFLEERNIYCVGSYAQHDDFMDIPSCIKRIDRLRNNNE